MTNWNLANKCRPHNRGETLRHFIIKSMVFKILFNEGYLVYTESEITKNKKTRVADVLAYQGSNINDDSLSIVVEVETKPTKKHNKELMKFYQDRTLYIIDVKKISDNIFEMEEQIKNILGF